MNVLLICPVATVTLEGTVRLELLLASDTANPLPDAVPVNVTEQRLIPGVLMAELMQLRLLKAVVEPGREIVPVPPLEAMRVPPAVAATTPVS
jgi:hypothetical protein